MIFPLTREMPIPTENESIKSYVQLKNAQIRSDIKECASDMEQLEQRGANHAVLMDVQIKLGKEEFASDMEQRSNFAVVKDVRINFREEESAGDIEQSFSTYAKVKDVYVMLRKEGCATSTVQTSRRR